MFERKALKRVPDSGNISVKSFRTSTRIRNKIYYLSFFFLKVKVVQILTCVLILYFFYYNYKHVSKFNRLESRYFENQEK